jgi:hypothetical protein
MDNQRAMKKYDVYNKNGARLCNAYGCRKHARLTQFGGAMWCRKHLPQIQQLRQVIQPHDGTKEEFDARLEELRLRKTMDYGHWHYASKLEKVTSVSDNTDIANSKTTANN